MTKRARDDGDATAASFRWKITFDDPAALRLVLETLGAVMQKATFKVVVEEGKYFLRVNGSDSALTCCVFCQLALDDNVAVEREGELHGEEVVAFCLECKHASIAIGASATIGTISIEGDDREPTVVIKQYDPDHVSHDSVSRLATYVDGEAPLTLEDMEFTTLMELETSKLKDMVKKARLSHTEVIRFSVYKKDQGAIHQSVVVLSVKGDNQEHELKFCHNIVYLEDGCMVVRAITDGDTAVFDYVGTAPVYDAAFPVDKIDSFVKNLPCRMIKARIAKDLPIMLCHDVNGTLDGSSYIRFLVAAVTEEPSS